MSSDELETHEFTITDEYGEDHAYHVTVHGAEHSLSMLPLVSRFVGRIMGPFATAIEQLEQEGDADDIMDAEVGDLTDFKGMFEKIKARSEGTDFALDGASVESLFMNVADQLEEGGVQFYKDLLVGFSRGDAKGEGMQKVVPNFNHMYQGRLWEMFQACYKSLVINYGPCLRAVLGSRS